MTINTSQTLFQVFLNNQTIIQIYLNNKTLITLRHHSRTSLRCRKLDKLIPEPDSVWINGYKAMTQIITHVPQASN